MHARMRVSVVLLRIHDGDGRYVNDLFDRGGTLQHVDWTAHSHQDRADQFSAAHLGHQFRCNVGRSEIRENENIGPTLQRTEGVKLFDNLWGEGFVGHNFSVDDQGGVGEFNHLYSPAYLGADGMIHAPETGE